MCLEFCCNWLLSPCSWSNGNHRTYVAANVYPASGITLASSTRPFYASAARVSPAYIHRRPVIVNNTPRPNFTASTRPPAVVHARPVPLYNGPSRSLNSRAIPLYQDRVIPGYAANRATAGGRVVPGNRR